MIAHVIGRRQSFGRVLGYLAGRGRSDEHVNPRILSGDREAEPLIGGLDRDGARLAAEHLDTPRVAFGSGVQKPVWHAVLSQKAGEPALTPEQWRGIGDTYMRGMGFDRWVVVHHGATKAGHDHVHVVGSMVRDNGRAVRWDEQSAFNRSRTVRQRIERDFGLKGLASEQAGLRGMPGLSRTELERGRSTPERHDVALRVRAAHIEAGCEERFPRRLRAHGLEIRPRYREGTRDVDGCSYRLPGGRWYSGSKLAPDLSLPKMREAWRQPSQAQEVSGAFASMSRARERTPGPLARISREVSRSAQGADFMAGAQSLRLAAQLTNPDKGPQEWLLIGITAIRAAQGIHAAHVAAGHEQMAQELERIRGAWQSARPGLERARQPMRPLELGEDRSPGLELD